MDRRTFLALASGTAALAGSCRRAEESTNGTLAGAGTVSVAAAANLIYAVEALNREFAVAAPGVIVKTTVGASGSLFAQLQHGAPFDVFLSADMDYPARAVAGGLGEAASLRTFATGRLVAWTTRTDVNLDDIRAAIESPQVHKVAIAQPQTAPYGRAAQRALETLGVLDRARPKFVVGESIAQTAQFVETGNAELGFVALSLVRSGRLAGTGRWVEIPAGLHTSVPLDHAAVLTRRGARNPAARRYLEFLGSQAARKVLLDFGYGVP